MSQLVAKTTPTRPMSPTAAAQAVLAAQALQDELQDAAEQFAKDYAQVTDEKSHGQNFMRDLCRVYKLESRHAVRFEHRVKGEGRKRTNFVDGFFPGLLLVEMKTAGKDLDAAYAQARDYVSQLKKPEEKPRHILVCDFQNLHLYDEREPEAAPHARPKAPVKFKLSDFRQHVNELDFLLGYERLITERQEKANIEAAGRLGELHDAIKATGYKGHDLQTLLVRLLFCMFADDTGLFDAGGQDAAAFATPFADLMKDTQSDGRNLSDTLNRLFAALDTAKPEPKRKSKKLDAPAASITGAKNFYATIAEFPYVNGDLFHGRLADCNFDAGCRSALLHCCQLDWSEISPDIFGTLFQHIMHWDNEESGGKSKKRREFGAHYTSERNILRAIRPLFLDDLATELDEIKGDAKLLKAFHARLGELKILDPACGCGNFLVVAYRELRLLEQQVLQALEHTGGGQIVLPICDVHQFYGIEIDPTAVEIATVAMWLTDHQMNMRLKAKPRIPLNNKAKVVCANALRLDWNTVLPAQDCDFIVGNPPFLGKKERSTAQQRDMDVVFKAYKKYGVLDYVAAWYVKAAAQMKVNARIKTAFVSTNSITQGEQVAVLWPPIMDAGVYITFAHRTFKWRNEGSGLAAVHCVIIGLGTAKPNKCNVWDYKHDLSADTKPTRAKRLNAYLVDAPFVTLKRRSEPFGHAPKMRYGSMPIDDGHLILSPEEYAQAVSTRPDDAALIRLYTGGDEFLNSLKRYCLWLEHCTPAAIQSSPFANHRIAKTAKFRLKSKRETTRKLGLTPHLFGEIRQPNQDYLLLPKVSSEQRQIMPIGFVSAQTIASGSALIIPGAGNFHLAVLSSSMHNAWMRAVCGRMKSDYQYSAGIVYNNFPWPADLSVASRAAIAAAGQALLDVRAKHAGKSLAWLYNTDTMPASIQAAHDAIDEAVDEAYGYMGGDDDAPRVAFLFELYQKLTSLFPQGTQESQEDEQTLTPTVVKIKSKRYKKA